MCEGGSESCGMEPKREVCIGRATKLTVERACMFNLSCEYFLLCSAVSQDRYHTVVRRSSDLAHDTQQRDENSSGAAGPSTQQICRRISNNIRDDVRPPISHSTAYVYDPISVKIVHY